MALNLKYIRSGCVNKGLMLKYFLGDFIMTAFSTAKNIILGHHEVAKLL